jgi:hypothetical protein
MTLQNNPIPNDFLCAKTVVKSREIQKSTFGGTGISIDYESWGDEEKDWISKPIRDQIKGTISSIQKKPMKDGERAYVVLGLSSSFTPHKTKRPENIHIFDEDTKKILKSLSAEFVAYLNIEHNRLLVACPISSLSRVSEVKKGCNSKYYQNLRRLSPLTLAEQISSNLSNDEEWHNTSKPVLIQLIPNISPELSEKYSSQVTKFLVEKNKELVYSSDKRIFAQLDKDSATELLETSNLVFQINEAPEGVARQLKANKRKISKAFVETESSAINEDTSIQNHPIICLMDSGVSDIQVLKQIVVARDGFNCRDYEDGFVGYGHGTPIACLASMGEGLGVPKVKIISYKIFAEDKKILDLRAYEHAINKYSNQTRIFLSSINFKRLNAYSTSELDHFIQENNVCFLLSAGNIRDTKQILDYALQGIPCESYIHNHPVEDPASAVSIMAVGAFSRKQSPPNSIAISNGLAPFTLCGVTNNSLYNCPKPEVVQSGGNFCKDKTLLGLESYDKYGQKQTIFCGTSFASPLLARNIAQIDAKYGHRIKNAETLKAIAIASATKPSEHICMGFGETKEYTTCDDGHALVYSEGEIPLVDKISIDGFNVQYKATIKLKVPTGVGSVELFIVHSDNNYLTTVPCLNTYLKVFARKEGNETGVVQLANPDILYKKAHMKVFRWAFSRTSMQGMWTFTIIPEPTIDMLPEHQKNTIVRFGCAFVLTSRSKDRGLISLTEKLHLANRRYLER